MAVKSATAIVARPPPESKTYKNHVALHGPEEIEHTFTFTRVFPLNTTQKQFFDETTQQHVRNVLNGQDALMFSYGVTNGGKTYTFQGKVLKISKLALFFNQNPFLGTDAEPGLVPRSLNLLFQTIKDRLIVEPVVMPALFRQCEFIDAKKRQEMAASKKALYKFLDTGVSFFIF